MNKLYPLFLQHLERYPLIRDNDTVILGLSGGKDSVTLFYLLHELKKRKDRDFRLVAAYFNHKLRTDAGAEQQWVTHFCDTHNTELVVGSKDVMQFKSRNKLNLEHAASISRYRFFQQVSARFPNAKVATAHTQSDLTETFFIKLFRGSGLQGLSTIFHQKQNTLIRPLLLFSEDQINAFLKRNHISFYSDYTNQQDQFLRNRIRHHIVPEVLKIEPDIHRHVFKTVNIIQEEYDYFSRTALDILQQQLIMKKVLPAATLPMHHVAIQRHIIREYIRLLKGDLLNIDFRHIEEIRTQHSHTGGIAIPGLELTFHKGYIFPNNFTIPDYSLTIDPLDPQSTTRTVTIEPTGCRLTITQHTGFQTPSDNFSLLVPLSSLTFPLTLRTPQTGDKYVKLNSTVNQKVAEMIRTAGLPAQLRNLYPCLVNGDGAVIWSTGSPVADRFKAVKGDSGFLTFVFQQ